MVPDTAPWSFQDFCGVTHSGRGSGTIDGIPAGRTTLTWGALADADPPWANPVTRTLMPGSQVVFRDVYRPYPGPVNIRTVPATTGWSFTDSLGGSHRGTGSGKLDRIPCGPITLSWSAPAGYRVPGSNPVAQTLKRGEELCFTQVLEPTAPGADQDYARILRCLLGMSVDPAGLDLTGDGKVTAADLIKALSRVSQARN